MTREQEILREALGKLMLVSGLLGLRDPRKASVEKSIYYAEDAVREEATFAPIKHGENGDRTI